MDFIIHAVFAAAGMVLGFLTPDLARSIVRYKCAEKGNEFTADRRYTSVSLKLSLCILNGLAWMSAGFWMEDAASALLLSVLFSTAAVVAWIDIRIRIVPNELVLLMLLAGSAFQTVHSGLSALLVSGLCMAAVVLLFTVAALIAGLGTVGAGDVKLAGAMALALGYPGILTALILMSAALLFCSLLGLFFGKLTLHTMVPLAPFMMFGMMGSLICSACSLTCFAV